MHPHQPSATSHRTHFLKGKKWFELYDEETIARKSKAISDSNRRRIRGAPKVVDNRYYDRLSTGVCTYCGGQPITESRLCESCRDKTRKQDVQRSRRMKETVLNHYGHICNWPKCGVKDSDMLSIDHVYNDGAVDRKKIGGSGNVFYNFLIQNNFPEGRYQILCHNHQWKKRMILLRSEELPTEVRG